MAFPLLLPIAATPASPDPIAPASPERAPLLSVSHDFDTGLWSRLEAMHVDPPDAGTTFVARLARENRWSLPFAHQVIGEYRRFLYLAARAGHPVSPPEAVDKAWHLHLIYTRHYWGVLCREILGFELHHDPARGGAGEAARLADGYRRTMESYHAAFGAWPPPAIWPAAEGTRHIAPGTRRTAPGPMHRYKQPTVGTFLLPAGAALLGLSTSGVVMALFAGLTVLALVWSTWSTSGGPGHGGRPGDRYSGGGGHGGGVMAGCGGSGCSTGGCSSGSGGCGGGSGCGGGGGCGGGSG